MHITSKAQGQQVAEASSNPPDPEHYCRIKERSGASSDHSAHGATASIKRLLLPANSSDTASPRGTSVPAPSWHQHALRGTSG